MAYGLNSRVANEAEGWGTRRASSCEGKTEGETMALIGNGMNYSKTAPSPFLFGQPNPGGYSCKMQ